MISIGSPLKKSVFSLPRKVSVGHAPGGVGDFFPVGALILVSTFSLARICAPSLESRISLVTFAPVIVVPASLTGSLPLVLSGYEFVLMMYWSGLSDIFFTTAITLSDILSNPV